jgi:hypothetical protein
MTINVALSKRCVFTGVPDFGKDVSSRTLRLTESSVWMVIPSMMGPCLSKNLRYLYSRTVLRSPIAKAIMKTIPKMPQCRLKLPLIRLLTDI